MAQLNGLISKLTGSAGQFTFKRRAGRTIVSEKETVKSIVQFVITLLTALLTTLGVQSCCRQQSHWEDRFSGPAS